MTRIPPVHRVAYMHEFGAPLSIESVPTPKPVGEQVLIKVVGAGICHSDVHVWKGEFTEVNMPPRLPWVLSHEITGVVVDRGERVPDTIGIGQKVLVFAWGWTEEDEWVLRGYSNVTEKPWQPSLTDEGGLREYFLVPHYKFLVDMEGIDDLVAAAPLACAGLTTFRAVKKARNVLDVDDYVVVAGLGGLGAYAVQWLRILAPYVNIIGVDTRDEAIEFVSKIAKLDEVINASREDPFVQVMIITKGKGAKVVLDFVGPKALPTYFLTLSKRGVYILVGLMGMETTIMRLPLLTYREQTIMGSFVGTLPEQYEVVSLAKKGKIDYKSVVTRRLKLEEATAALEALEKGQVLGRQVVVFE